MSKENVIPNDIANPKMVLGVSIMKGSEMLKRTIFWVTDRIASMLVMAGIITMCNSGVMNYHIFDRCCVT